MQTLVKTLCRGKGGTESASVELTVPSAFQNLEEQSWRKLEHNVSGWCGCLGNKKGKRDEEVLLRVSCLKPRTIDALIRPKMSI